MYVDNLSLQRGVPSSERYDCSSSGAAPLLVNRASQAGAVILQFGSQLDGDFFEFVRVVRGGSSGAEFTDAVFGSYRPNHHDANFRIDTCSFCERALDEETPHRSHRVA
jgi:hypothetical protein